MRFHPNPLARNPQWPATPYRTQTTRCHRLSRIVLKVIVDSVTVEGQKRIKLTVAANVHAPEAPSTRDFLFSNIVNLGQALLFQCKFDDIESEITPDAAATDLERTTVFRLGGEALMGLRQPVAARESFEQTLKFDSSDPAARLGDHLVSARLNIVKKPANSNVFTGPRDSTDARQIELVAQMIDKKPRGHANPVRAYK